MSDRETWAAEVFDRIYAGSADPWRYRTSPYERAKYAQTLAVLPARAERALEVGCSIGVMTALLAPRCGQLLALDGAAAAVERACAHCTALPQVSVRHARVPDGLPDAPDGGWDLMLLSEMLYFLSPTDLRRLGRALVARAAPHATIVLVNWTGETDTPCTGDEAADVFTAACHGFRPTLHLRGGSDTEHYRLDRLER